ncbi:MAG: hypothetical protein H0W12_09730 [Chitinophagaceae bacterium]|nr:hypothetical protein [Chitinophagaceae bacterium]
MKKSIFSSMWNNFKHAMYALMVIVIAMSIPVLSYLELSYNLNTPKVQSVVKGNNKVFLQKQTVDIKVNTHTIGI